MATLMMLMNDVVMPIVEAVEKLEAEEQALPKQQLKQTERPDTLVGPRDLLQSVTSDKHSFTIKLDVRQFRPEEVTVTSSEDAVTIEGKHEEKQDEHGYVSRHFVRRYALPKDVDMDKAECGLSTDGILCIKAPKVTEAGERIIPIKFTNAPAAVAFAGCQTPIH